MGKATRLSKEKQKQQRHQPLAQQLREDDGVLRNKRNKRKKEQVDEEEEDEVKENFVSKNLSKKILKQAKDQLQEEEEEEDEEGDQVSTKTRRMIQDDSDDEFSEEEEEEVDYEGELEQITEEDERLLQQFMNPSSSKGLTLADVIMDKIKEKEMQASGQMEGLEEQVARHLDPKVVEVYRGVGHLLSKYSSGKIPKAFKIIPSLNNWEEVLFLTTPDKWTPNAMRQATRLFASNLNARMAQRFYSLILLPRVLQNINDHKKLNYHLYMSLKKALYKPAAFFKGILLPICESGRCTLRQATIIASVIQKLSIPVLHSSAAIMKIAQMPYLGVHSLFLKVLLNKKYALPFRVIDVVVDHFSRFKNDHRKLHLLWHQSLLAFVQRYKNDLLPQQKDELKQLTKKHQHEYFEAEVARELSNSKSRGDELQQDFDFEMDWS